MTTQNFDLVFRHLQALKMHAKENLPYGTDSPPHTNMGPYHTSLDFFLSSFFQSESLRESAKKHTDFGRC